MTYFADKLDMFDLPAYALLDGAIVDDIETHLASRGLVGRSLFRGTLDRQTVLAGPWLVTIGRNRTLLEHSVGAARDAGKGVFWLGACGEDTLFRHFRRLNAARMPDGRVLYFRHYDSDVLAAIAPLLDSEQAASLFGPAEAFGFIGGSSDGGTVIRPAELSTTTPSGPITFHQWQIDELDERQRVLSRKKIAGLLRDEYRNELEHMSDEQLYRKILHYDRECEQLRLTSEYARWTWASLNIDTKDRASANEDIRKKLNSVPNEIVSEVFVLAAPDFLRSYRQKI